MLRLALGSNSIPNQVAALSGCLSARFELCGLDFMTDIGKICNDKDNPHYGLRLERARVSVNETYWCTPRDTDLTFPKSPYLPAIAESLGYINFL